MNTLSKYVLLLLVSVLAACCSDDDAAATFTPGTPQPGDPLAVTITASDFVTDGDPDTRATDSGPVTTFEDGDRVGIIILDKDKQPLYNNIPYKYVSSSQTWEFDNGNGEGKKICYYDSKAHTYIVYYPYSAKADDCKSESDLKAIFKPQTDQSRKEDYRASDLMVKTTTSVTPLKSLTAKLEHVYASISLVPTAENAKYVLEGDVAYTGNYKPNNADISNVNLTVGDDIYFLHQAADGTWRCILPAGTGASEPVRCFYTIGSKTYGNAIGIGGGTVANTRYTSSPDIDVVTYSLGNARVGDFYCKNSKNEGYLIPGDATLTEEQKTACIGIVFWLGDATAKDLTLKNDYQDCTHGLVVALKDAIEGRTVWQNSGSYSSVQRWLDSSNPSRVYLSVAGGYGSGAPVNNIQGYNNTKAIEEFNVANRGNLVHAVVKAAEYRNATPTPDNSSIWYLPSAKELTLLCGKDVDDIGQNHSGGTTANRDLINDKLNSISSVATQIQSARYWSSTEYSTVSFYAFGVDFDSGFVDYYDKNDAYRVRCVLAF